MDDLLDSIEKGKFDIPGFLTTDLPIWVLILSVMNRTYLKHIINELYPNEIERKQIFVKLEEETETEINKILLHEVERRKQK